MCCGDRVGCADKPPSLKVPKHRALSPQMPLESTKLAWHEPQAVLVEQRAQPATAQRGASCDAETSAAPV